MAGTIQTLWDDDTDAARVFPTEEAALDAVKAFIARCDWLSPEEQTNEFNLWVVEPNISNQ
jgi:mRNA-degrading endonuclease HigB of HigAB toxin-antitoxin module